jgi:membrane fusion protein, multidrug efflux system
MATHLKTPANLDLRTEERLPSLQERRPKRGSRRRFRVLTLLALALIGYGGYRWYEQYQADQAAVIAKKRAQPPPRVPVVAVPARRGNMPVYLTGLGSVQAFNTVTLKSRVDGQIMQIYFKEGEFVQKGDPLVDIDPRPFQVQLLQAQGQLARDQSQLSNAKLDLDRYQKLAKDGAISRQQFDTQSALVGQYQGGITSDQAAIDNAKLQLTYCHITSPINGRVGLRLVDIGNIVHATDPTGLLVITQLQPIAVLFTLPEDNLPPVLKRLNSGQGLTAEAYNREGTVKIATGSLLTVDNQIDQTTGTARLKAIFDNKENTLFPNQFLNVRLLLGVDKGVVIMPAAALQRGPNGTFVYVVKPDQTAELRLVKPGITEGDQMSVASGLAPGELVVVDGADKLQQGTKMEVHSGTVSYQRPPV